ncbi:MAG: NAD(P)H-dependent glycerol-3-phosphate dehydrogenase [Lentisphaeria bacterium]|jgi:glycerol-3-phosphate dehydrogenase (NAD(P)+)|nr:NAD(P)H-dependent glycerol-3-phosphate dehydrogenase [Lentisphaeria bacterium]MDP7743163.1 NAD(P)H-dependent glycerol-3-phosphate dehydrogenase [Lentisphaeria bacterium]
MKITVLSDGGWGTALALLLVENKHDVTVWGPFADYVEEMKQTRRNDRFLKGAELPPALGLTADMATAAEADLLVLAAPTQFARGCLEQLAAAGVSPDTRIVNVSKGIEVGSLLRISELIEAVLGPVRYAGLSGPSHAEEVFRRVPTAVTVGSTDSELATEIQSVFMNQVFRVYTSDDVIGVELGGALKNVYAIAAGICDGMALGDNSKAALMTRAIAEMGRLGGALGGRAETFSGLSGIGDMIVTCCSGHSRNRHVGEELGRGKALDLIIEEMGMVVAEGVKTSESAYELAEKVGAETPIIREVYASLYEDKDPRVAVRDLMARDPRPERG